MAAVQPRKPTNDAEAICEAAQRPTMRFVPVKSEQTQGSAMVFRVREVLIRQRTQLINALRGHLTEFGQIATGHIEHSEANHNSGGPGLRVAF